DGPTAAFPSASTTPTYQTATPRLSYGEPFAPHGPYQPLDPTRRPGYYDPRNFAPQAPQRRPKRAKSVIGVLTTLLALIIGVIVVAVQTSPSGTGSPSLVVVSGAMLVTIGAGLLVATWWGRGAGLVALGTVIALAAAVGLMFSGLPKKITDAVWTPRSMQDVPQTYSVGIGEGTLDLTELPLQAGSTTTFNASISVGELTVIVPPTARVEVHATNRVGDIKIDHQVNGGTSLEINETLEPEVEPRTGEPATIVLRIKGGVGDMEVRRAA
ncbi:MAG: hypothetical protein HOV86_21760, partial [Thermoactinospora sp.]|nr:hypothetical protein [Thermoactinospora sp.]